MGKTERLKLSRWLDQVVLPHYFPLKSDLIQIIDTIITATLPIRGLLERGITSREINIRMNIDEPEGESKNIYDEDQIHEDILTHSIILQALTEAEIDYSFIASEEAEPIIGNGTFGITIDPVDGSSNVLVNRTVGTIVGIWDEQGKIVCAFYVLYGIFTNLIISINGKVAEFILDTTPYSMTFYHFIYVREFENLQPKYNGIMCLGGNPNHWPDRCRKYEQELIKNNLKNRYSGSFVGDFHAILHYGGVYSYFPSPKGKIRLYYEWLPLAFITKTLGGEFIIVDPDNKGKCSIKNFNEADPLKKEDVNRIHSITCGGLLGSINFVQMF